MFLVWSGALYSISMVFILALFGVSCGIFGDAFLVSMSVLCERGFLDLF